MSTSPLYPHLPLTLLPTDPTPAPIPAPAGSAQGKHRDFLPTPRSLADSHPSPLPRGEPTRRPPCRTPLVAWSALCFTSSLCCSRRPLLPPASRISPLRTFLPVVILAGSVEPWGSSAAPQEAEVTVQLPRFCVWEFSGLIRQAEHLTYKAHRSSHGSALLGGAALTL